MSSRNRKKLYLSSSRDCLECNGFLSDNSGEGLKCNVCGKYKSGVCSSCNRKICDNCIKEPRPRKKNTEKHVFNIQSKTCILSLIIGIILLICAPICIYMKFEDSEVTENLCSHFPSQRNDTWHHINSVINMSNPTVKSLTLLHDEDNKTSECLARKLIKIYKKDKSVKIEDLSFGNITMEVKDYGEVLEYYRVIVEKYGVLLTDLSKIPGSIARIFHSLCDEVSSPIKPSFFIFMLKYDDNSKHLKPLKRAMTILEEAWDDLPGSELYPLLSRVIKNVIDVIPERQIDC